MGKVSDDDYDDWDYKPKASPSKPTAAKKPVQAPPPQVQNVTYNKGAGCGVWLVVVFTFLISVVSLIIGIVNLTRSKPSSTNSVDLSPLEQQISSLDSRISNLEIDYNNRMAAEITEQEQPFEEYTEEIVEETDPEESIGNAIDTLGNILSAVDEAIPDSVDDALVDPDFKQLMDDYEKFFDEYVDFMTKYNTSDEANRMSMMNDMLGMIQQEGNMMRDLQNLKDERQLSGADLSYYLLVLNRINQKIASIPPES